MATATLTSKGQVTIPRAIREQLGVTPGSRIDFLENDRGEIVVRQRTTSVKSLARFLPYDGPAATIEQMNEAIAAGAARGMM